MTVDVIMSQAFRLITSSTDNEQKILVLVFSYTHYQIAKQPLLLFDLLEVSMHSTKVIFQFSWLSFVDKYATEKHKQIDTIDTQWRSTRPCDSRSTRHTTYTNVQTASRQLLGQCCFRFFQKHQIWSRYSLYHTFLTKHDFSHTTIPVLSVPA